MVTLSWYTYPNFIIVVMPSTPVVIDIEYFHHRHHEWVVKEIAIYGDYLNSITLKPPFPLHALEETACKSYAWATSNLHHIHWNSGEVPYDQLYTFTEGIKLWYPTSEYYSKGFEKCVFLGFIFGKRFNDLDDLKCPKLENLVIGMNKVSCSGNTAAHSMSGHCARQKAFYYSVWLKNYLQQNGVHEN